MPDSFVDLTRGDATLQEAVLALTNAHKVETSELWPEKLRAMLDAAHLALARPDGSAFVIAFDEGADYDSPNFRWCRDHYPQFLYVDRVVVAAEARGRGFARALYGAVFATAAASGRERVLCEVNLEPPNPASDAFHEALGFTEAGRASPTPGKLVRYLERRLG